MKKSKMENDLKKAFEKGSVKILNLSQEERNSYRIAAKATLAKDKVITLRINGKDLNALK
jgi:predicted DNA binding CopG/RHH family protein